jgi:hypothetical protein
MEAGRWDGGPLSGGEASKGDQTGKRPEKEEVGKLSKGEGHKRRPYHSGFAQSHWTPILARAKPSPSSRRFHRAFSFMRLSL